MRGTAGATFESHQQAAIKSLPALTPSFPAGIPWPPRVYKSSFTAHCLLNYTSGTLGLHWSSAASLGSFPPLLFFEGVLEFWWPMVPGQRGSWSAPQKFIFFKIILVRVLKGKVFSKLFDILGILLVSNPTEGKQSHILRKVLNPQGLFLPPGFINKQAVFPLNNLFTSLDFLPRSFPEEGETAFSVILSLHFLCHVPCWSFCQQVSKASFLLETQSLLDSWHGSMTWADVTRIIIIPWTWIIAALSQAQSPGVCSPSKKFVLPSLPEQCEVSNSFLADSCKEWNQEKK